MELDLFSLQGVVVEKETPTTDLFSIQGVVVEKAAGAVDVIRTGLTVAQKTPATVEVAATRLMVAQMSDGTITLPLGIAPLDSFKNLAQAKVGAPIVWSKYALSKPRVDGNGEGKTQVDLTPLSDAPSRGKHTVTYFRRSAVALATLKLNAANYSSLADVVADLRSRTLMVDISDFDVSKSKLTATSLLLVTNPDSYLFYPSAVTFGAMPTLASEFTNTDLDGFEKVPLLPLAEVFTNTDLNGFTPK